MWKVKVLSDHSVNRKESDHSVSLSLWRRQIEQEEEETRPIMSANFDYKKKAKSTLLHKIKGDPAVGHLYP